MNTWVLVASYIAVALLAAVGGVLLCAMRRSRKAPRYRPTRYTILCTSELDDDVLHRAANAYKLRIVAIKR